MTGIRKVWFERCGYGIILYCVCSVGVLAWFLLGWIIWDSLNIYFGFAEYVCFGLTMMRSRIK
jgi:hypothetical protein